MASFSVFFIVFITKLILTKSRCESVTIPPHPMAMSTEKLLSRTDIKFDRTDKLEDIYKELDSSKRLLQINKCKDIYLLSLKDDIWSQLFSGSLKSITEQHSNLPENIQTFNNIPDTNNIYKSIGYLYYSGHGLIKFTNSHHCTATLITPKHILTSAHCVINKEKTSKGRNTYYPLNLNNFKFFPAADKQYMHWLDSTILSKMKFSKHLQTLGLLLTRSNFVDNTDVESMGIKNVFVPYSYVSDVLNGNDWALIELNREIFTIGVEDHKGYSLMSFGFDNTLDKTISDHKLVHFQTAGYPGNERCCQLYPKPFDVSRMNVNVLFDNIHKHYQGQSGSPIWKKDGLSYITYGILMGGEVIGTDAWRITNDEYFTICDLIKHQYPDFCHAIPTM